MCVFFPVREKMGNYAKAVQILQAQIVEAVLESLGLETNYIRKEIDEDEMQVMIANCYPSCPPEPGMEPSQLGMLPHTDHGMLTVLVQSCEGLQVKNQNSNWVPVSADEDLLIIQLGDQMEVMSNGLYQSVVHRATLNKDKKRFSIASVHSLPLNTKIGPALKLIDDLHPLSYKEYSFAEFLDYLSSNTGKSKRTKFIDTLKINP